MLALSRFPMYRRNIPHLLVPLGMTLVLILAYHLFIKPSASPVASNAVDAVVAAPEPPRPADVAVSREEPPQLRALDQTIAPPMQQASLLEVIRDDLERGSLSVAES